jgi:xanthine dehydrogenase molybdopterin-binding subunit B
MFDRIHRRGTAVSDKDPLDVRRVNFYGAAPRNVTHY